MINCFLILPDFAFCSAFLRSFYVLWDGYMDYRFDLKTLILGMKKKRKIPTGKFMKDEMNIFDLFWWIDDWRPCPSEINGMMLFHIWWKRFFFCPAFLNVCWLEWYLLGFIISDIFSSCIQFLIHDIGHRWGRVLCGCSRCCTCDP